MGSGIRWTPAMFEEFRAKIERRQQDVAVPVERRASKSKFKNEKVEFEGHTFDSKKEAARFAHLQLMQQAGRISELRRQVSFELAPAVKLDGEPRKKPALRYFADACYMQDGQLVVEDTKSAHTRKLDAYRIKRHLMATVHKIQIKEV